MLEAQSFKLAELMGEQQDLKCSLNSDEIGQDHEGNTIARKSVVVAQLSNFY